MVENASNLAVFIVGLMIIALIAVVIIMPIYHPPTHKKVGPVEETQEEFKALPSQVEKGFEETKELIVKNIDETLENRVTIVDSKIDVIKAVQTNRLILLLLIALVLSGIIIILLVFKTIKYKLDTVKRG